MGTRFDIDFELIKRCHEEAIKLCHPDFFSSMKQRKTAINSEYLASEIKTDFDAQAYTAYLIGKLGAPEFRAMLFFKKPSTLNILLGMIESQPDHVSLDNLKKMTGENISEKRFVNIVEFIHEYKSKQETKKAVRQ